MATITDIKNKIKAKLQALEDSGSIGELQADGVRTDLFTRDIAKYPCAILTPPLVEAESETNRDNIRTYVYDIVVVQRGEDIKDIEELEELQERLMDTFDNDPTLTGSANAGVDPTFSQLEMVQDSGKRYVVFVFTVRAKIIKELTF